MGPDVYEECQAVADLPAVDFDGWIPNFEPHDFNECRASSLSLPNTLRSISSPSVISFSDPAMSPSHSFSAIASLLMAEMRSGMNSGSERTVSQHARARPICIGPVQYWRHVEQESHPENPSAARPQRPLRSAWFWAAFA